MFGAVFWVILIGSLSVIALYLIGLYNSLVTLRNRFKNAFSQIEVQLKRRHDLIPNLVETAKAYMNHERGTLVAVTEARNVAAACLKLAAAEPGSARSIVQLGKDEGRLNTAMDNLNVSLEEYPDLQASEIMMQLNDEMTSTEDRIAYARQFFNDAVMEYNIFRQQFPTILMADAVGHGSDATLLVFEDSKQIQNAPTVSFT
ncbi:LemA family protein [Pseudomonas sp. MF6772]|jgi:LemA protein|uniref:LemA family protein n=1 Tax=Pseudomonas shahriarae TaxID=2745512 RepID=A0ABT5NIE3_9PSED|nr:MULTISPECIES: LemA family protein [Pseudomonas]SUD45306.1 LemA family protein [Pseudomonas fluorescens]MBJ2268634.1 LemA family protein [Pseudomonas sp. MF6772]MBL7229736.1 LemA family protein [Pseudomonas sp.]MCU0209603.1 LemA family protein [Pseudomonas shahriarae]MDD0983153.1 LemA family protein [Pseudomonas shahriarae]